MKFENNNEFTLSKYYLKFNIAVIAIHEIIPLVNNSVTTLGLAVGLR